MLNAHARGISMITKNVVALLAGVFAAALLSACGGADSTIVGFCQDAGDTKRNCTCIAKHLKKNLPKDDFQHFRTFIRETDFDSMSMEEQTVALFSMAFDPQMQNINAKYEAAKSVCVTG